MTSPWTVLTPSPRPDPRPTIVSLIQNPTPDDSVFASGVSCLPGIAVAQSSGGFSFPIFNKPGNLFGYLLGKDISLLTWDAGSLEAEDDLALPPVFIPFGPVVVKVTFGGFVGASGHLQLSYDTYGIRQALQTDSFGQGFDALLGSIVLDD